MNERQSIRRALAPLHASSDTLEEVLDMIDREKGEKYRKKAGRSALRGALVAAILVAALSVTVYAVGEYTGFFDTVFGNEAIRSKDPEHVELTDEEGNVWQEYDLPGQERVPVDQDMAEEVVGGDVATVSRSVTVQGVTFTVEDLVMDENGIGMLTYTMEDPNGFPTLKVAEDGRILFNVTAVGDMPTPGQTVLDGDGNEIAWMDEIDYAVPGGTDTKMTAVRYFCPVGDMTGAAEMTMTFSVATAFDPETLEREVEEGSVSFPMTAAAPAAALTGPDGWTAGVSPVGLKITAPAEALYSDHGFDDVIIHMADGADYALKQSGSDMLNYVVGYGGDSGVSYVFNRLIDPAQVQSVTAVGHGSGYQDENGRPVPYEEAWIDGNTLQDGLTSLDVDLDLTFTK